MVEVVIGDLIRPELLQNQESLERLSDRPPSSLETACAWPSGGEVHVGKI